MSAEHVNIRNCPQCKAEHRYRLEVKRALIFKALFMSDMHEMHERTRAVKVTRLFTCPVTKQDYQATFTLTDTSYNRIKDVSVVGLEADDEQE